jgi:hypothetical protein
MKEPSMHKGKLIVNLPNRPKDDEVEVFPYGLFKNGYAYEVEGLKGPNPDPDGEEEMVEVDELVVGDVKAKPPVVENLESEPDIETQTTSQNESPPVRSEDGAAVPEPNPDTNGGDE